MAGMSRGWYCGETFDNFRVVMLADDIAVDDAVPVSRHEAAMTRDTGEASQVVDVPLNLHHELTCRDRL